MTIKKHIPNAVTCLNLFSGCIACVMALQGSFEWVFIWVIFAALFDFLDGLIARLLKAYSPIGKELDSLADMVSFGLAPGLMTFSLLQTITSGFPLEDYIPYFAFLIPVFSALRLAKFNIDDRQTTSFIGLPVPANALFWTSTIVGTHSYAQGNEILYTIILLVLIIVFSFLLVSEIPMFSLKVKNLTWKDNQFQYILILSTIIAVIFLKWAGLGISILIYILISLLTKNPKK